MRPWAMLRHLGQFAYCFNRHAACPWLWVKTPPSFTRSVATFLLLHHTKTTSNDHSPQPHQRPLWCCFSSRSRVSRALNRPRVREKKVRVHWCQGTAKVDLTTDAFWTKTFDTKSQATGLTKEMCATFLGTHVFLYEFVDSHLLMNVRFSRLVFASPKKIRNTGDLRLWLGWRLQCPARIRLLPALKEGKEKHPRQPSWLPLFTKIRLVAEKCTLERKYAPLDPSSTSQSQWSFQVSQQPPCFRCHGYPFKASIGTIPHGPMAATPPTSQPAQGRGLAGLNLRPRSPLPHGATPRNR